MLLGETQTVFSGFQNMFTTESSATSLA